MGQYTTKPKKEKQVATHKDAGGGSGSGNGAATGGRQYKKQDSKAIAKFCARSTTEDVNKYYDITEKVLGRGNFSVVKLGVDRSTKERVAVKIVDKSGVKHKPEMLQNEVDILLRVDHPNVIKLLDLFENETEVYLVMELVTGGELFDRIVAKEQYSEEDAKEVMRQLFSALEYLHERGIVHRDLKPENLLLKDESNETDIKLTDFGLSKVYSAEMMNTACGTPGYVAPEILDSVGYDSAVDIWSAGVVMYILLAGYPPFYSENDAELFESIMQANYQFHSPYWDNVSAEAKDLISKLLVVDPAERLTAEQAIKEPWFQSTSKASKSAPLPSEMRQNLKDHNVTRKSMASIK